MKAILVIDLPNDLDISLDEIKADITVLSKDFRKSMLFLKYKNIALKPMPKEKDDLRYLDSYAKGYNDCIDEILGEEE